MSGSADARPNNDRYPRPPGFGLLARRQGDMTSPQAAGARPRAAGRPDAAAGVALNLQPPIVDERIVLDRQVLRVFFRSGAPYLACVLTDEHGTAAKTAPLLPIGGQYSCQFDLGDLAAGSYAITLRTADGAAHPFGRETALRHLALVRAGSTNRAGGAALKIAASTFAGGGGSGHAWLYVDKNGPALGLRVADTDDIDAFLGRAAPATAEPIRFSVISPVYNVEKYLDAFFESVTTQTLDFKSRIELIMVDDGSTDRSAKIIKRWQKKFPANIRYIHQANGGLSSARNRGLKEVSHEWITFTDPDDFVDRAYFSEVDRAIRKHGEGLALVSCNLIFHDDATGKDANTHALRHRFAEGERVVPADNLGRFIQLSANSAFFRKSTIASAKLEFDGRVRPSFEDAHLVGRYLLHEHGKFAVFLPQAKYFYRKRADQSSLVDKAKTHPEWYGDQLRYGCLGLLRATQRPDGIVPQQVQTTVLYELSWRFLHIVDQPEVVSFLSVEQRRAFHDLLGEIFALIEVRTITDYDISDLAFVHRVGILNLFKDADPAKQIVEVTKLDSGSNLAKVVYWSRHAEPSASFLVGDTAVAPAFAKRRRRDFLGAVFAWEHIVWLPIAAAERLKAHFASEEASIAVRRRLITAGVTGDQIRAGLNPRLRPGAALPESIRALRTVARSPDAMAQFRSAWLFMDRDSEADDSAEHLYRFVCGHRPDINAFFVLQRDCPHWSRLSAEGFRLIAFNEPEHAVALLNATHLVSSHVDHYVVGYLPREWFGDMLSHRTVFLQHGVIKDDISGWLNRIDLDLMVTSTPAEFHSIIDDGTAYKFGRKEVVLTGLPRHDALLSGNTFENRYLIVMPTWRDSLTGPALGPGNARSASPEFASSEFARRWRGILRSPRLLALATRHDRETVFVPHPNLEHQVDGFGLPAGIRVRRFSDSPPIREVFQKCALLVTDYSSKAFDVAYLGKPVVYYQFDPEVFFGGGHLARPGYFDYERDGFGPVITEEDPLLTAVEAFMEGKPPDPIYRARAEKTFIFRDGNCCERVFNSILDLERSYDSGSKVSST